MIKVSEFYESIVENDIRLFTGVPDSLLKDFLKYVNENAESHIITANEGSSVALAAGHFIGTGKPALVYLQNSGLGNTINPLLSLCDPQVYSIPMVVLIGWRGEPGVKDEPQHVKQGSVTPTLLESMGVPFEVVDADSEYRTLIKNVIQRTNEEKRPVAVLVRKGTFEKYEGKSTKENPAWPKREDAIQSAAKAIDTIEDAFVVSTTGMISRELYSYRHDNDKVGWDFYSVGSMGHANQIALGASLSNPNSQFFCFDGDGALIMHMGTLTTIGSLKPKNFYHLIFDNEAHDSVGGQSTASGSVDFCAVAKGVGYSSVYSVNSLDKISDTIVEMVSKPGPALLSIKVQKGNRSDLMRPTLSPAENLEIFARRLQK